MKKKFSIILLHYHQEQYIKEALDSIFEQTYDNIELIIADDHSERFNKQEIENYIKNHSNIDYKVFVNDENIGTVKSLNRAFKEASGEYVLVFAADDVLKDKTVVKKYVESFNKYPNFDVISSVCILYDNKLEKVNGYFPEMENIDGFNKLTSKDQNRRLCFGPAFAPGATAYKMKMIKKLGYLDEQYKLIEDWSFFLRLTRSGYKVHIEPFESIKHRGGGVSEKNKMPKDVCDKILKDTDLIYRNEVFINLKEFDTEEKLSILYRYRIFINTYGYKYWPIFRNYYSLIFKHQDVFWHEILGKKDSLLIILPVPIVLFWWIIYLFTKNKYLMIFGPIVLYLMLRKIINVSYLRRSKNEKEQKN